MAVAMMPSNEMDVKDQQRGEAAHAVECGQAFRLVEVVDGSHEGTRASSPRRQTEFAGCAEHRRPSRKALERGGPWGIPPGRIGPSATHRHETDAELFRHVSEDGGYRLRPLDLGDGSLFWVFERVRWPFCISTSRLEGVVAGAAFRISGGRRA